MKTRISQHYDTYHWSCECGASSGGSIGYADEDFARRAAQLHTEMMHPGMVIKQQAEAIAELSAALTEAVDLIRQWHNMDTEGLLTQEEHEITWRIYQKSPEMQRINAALSKVQA